MLKNKLFQTFIDYRGTVSRREFWAGVTLFVLLTLTTIANSSPDLFYDLLKNAGYNHDTFYLSMLTTNLYGFRLPFDVLALYILTVAVVKRAKALSTPRGLIILMVLVVFLFNSVIYSASNMNFSSSESGAVSPLFILAIIHIVLGLTTILVLGILRSKEDRKKDRNDEKYDGIKCLLNIGRLFIFIAIVIFIFSFSMIPYILSQSLDKYLTRGCTIISAIGIIIYIYILVKRSNDAGVSTKKILGVSFIYILFVGTLIVLGRVTLLPSFLVISANSIISVLSTCVTLLTIVLIALPSKIEEKTQQSEEYVSGE